MPDRETIGLLAIALLFLLLLLRVPLAIAIGLVSFFGIATITSVGAAWGIVTSIPFSMVGEISLTAIPMFLLMGFIAASCGLTNGLFESMKRALWRVPGGLACASVGACTLFSAASGSSVATAAAMGRIAIPEMLRANYAPSLAAGSVASAGTLGALIPPSILMVIYGIFAQVSIGQLFVAGFLPGLLTALAFMGLIVVRVLAKPSLAPRVDRWVLDDGTPVLRNLWPLPVLIIGVLGGIFFGIFTPTEAGGVGAALALLLALLRGGLTRKRLTEAAMQTAEVTCTLFLIAIAAAMLTRFMALSGLPSVIEGGMRSVSDDPMVIVLMICVILLVLGCFIDGFGIMLLTLPVFLPILNAHDVNLIWFGIIFIKLIEIGLITPPVGLNLFVIKSSAGVPFTLSQVALGSLWFVLADLFVLGLLLAFPIISLILPSLM